MPGLLLAGAAAARPPEERLARLARGVSVTGWFRHPPGREPGRVEAYLSDAAIAGLRAAGFTFVRLAVDVAELAPEGRLSGAWAGLLERAVARLGAAGLAVVVVPFAPGWRLEERAADRAALLRLWRGLAPLLARHGADGVFPEILNEPVFAEDPPAWARLQAEALGVIRAAWPEATVIVTGARWGGVDGLLALPPPGDGNVVASVHFYEPAVLTALAAWEAGLDRAALARLAFPAGGPGCVPDAATGRTRAVAAFYCAGGWDAARLAARLAAAAAWGRRAGVPVLLGEFGAARALNGPARLAWIAAARAAAERVGMGWALWGYDDAMGFALPRPPPARPVLDPDLLRALGLRGAPRKRPAASGSIRG